MKILLTTLLLLPLSIPASGAAAGQSLEISDLETRVIAREEGRWFGRATVERTAAGALVLCYRGASRHTGSDGVIHVRFSNDGGQNWSDADHALDESDCQAGTRQYNRRIMD